MRPLRLLSLAVAATAALTLAACSTTAPGAGSDVDVPPAEDGAFPVTIEHAYGETTITEQPLRVASVAWANHEVPLALGIVPVIQEKVTWGDDDGRTLYLTAQTGLYRVRLKIPGIRPGGVH